MRKWQCVVCGFIYDEALGLPEEGIPAGTRWEDIPADWVCPDCGAIVRISDETVQRLVSQQLRQDCGVGKIDFEMIEIA